MSATLLSSCLIVGPLLLGQNPAAATLAPPVTGQLKQVTYPVADLVVPTDDHSFPEEGDAKEPAAGKQPVLVREANKSCEDQLIKLITATIAPASWSGAGGPGSVRYYPVGLGLVITQTQEVHEQIVHLLAALRRLQEVEVATEFRLVELPDLAFERIGIDFSSPTAGQSGRPAQQEPQLNLPITNSKFDFSVPPFGSDAAEGKGERGQAKARAFLDDLQVRELLKACQGDTRTSVLAMPRVTTFTGQRAFVHSCEKKYFLTGFKLQREHDQAFLGPNNEAVEIGWRLTFRATASADRRFVQLNLRANETTVEPTVPLIPVQIPIPPEMQLKAGGNAPQVFQAFLQQPAIKKFELKESLNIADGATAVLYCGTILAEGRNEFGPPVLSKIPYVNRLCKNVGYGRETRHRLLLVTPRIIIINQEEEQVFLGQLPPLPRP